MPDSRALACGILVGLLGATASGETPGATWPPSVATALAELMDQCTGADGTPNTENAVQRADLNADGTEDFVLYAGWIVCENAWSIYGDREKVLTVFAGDGDGGATQAFSDMVFDAKIERQGNDAQLWLGISAEGCGRPRAETFAEETFCDRPIEWRTGAARFDYAPLDSVRLIE
jgi:hypothetical protein